MDQFLLFDKGMTPIVKKSEKKPRPAAETQSTDWSGKGGESEAEPVLEFREEWKQKVLELTKNSTNRKYKPSLLEREVQENCDLLRNQDPKVSPEIPNFLIEIELLMTSTKNLAFCQAISIIMKKKQETLTYLQQIKPIRRNL